jgi:alkyl sulfatase BDS1-like metallo-beta-lactamase superfamily hydrolase
VISFRGLAGDHTWASAAAALAGPEREFFAAQLAYRRGDLRQASTLVHKCIETYPGSRRFQDFAAELDQLAGAQAAYDSRPEHPRSALELPDADQA